MARHRALRTAARAALGFLLGLGVWLGVSEPYDGLLAFSAEPLMRLFESPAVTRLKAEERVITVEREDFPPASPRPDVPAPDLTFNVILLAALFAADRHPLWPRNMTRFLLAAGILVLVHLAALIAKVESIYAMDLGPWSAAHYGWFARNFWASFTHFYRVVGCFAAAFLLWWWLRPSEEEAGGRKRRR